MSVKPPRIECARCQKVATAKDTKCPSCGSRLVKVCGQCGFKNSAAKNYCDSCGAPQTDEAVSSAKSPVTGTQPGAAAKPPTAKPSPSPAKPSDAKPSPSPAKPSEPKPPASPAKPSEPKPSASPAKPPEPKPAQPPAKVVVPLPHAEPPAPKPAQALPEAPPAAKPLEVKAPSTPAARSTADDTDPKADPLRTHPKNPVGSEPPPASPSEPAARIELPKTQIARAPVPPPKRPPPPVPGDPRKARIAEDLRLPTPAATVEAPPSKGPGARRPQLPAVLAAALALSLSWFAFTRWQATAPQRSLLKTAMSYLTALQSRDLGKAYSMVSSESRQAVSLGEYQASQDTADWSFSDVAIYQLKPDWATVRYKLSVAGHPAKDDWLSFVREGRTWRRAYWWPLSGKIEDALERGAAEEALSLAKQAARIDPRDALAQSYVCEADYGRADFQSAERDCLSVLELNKFYPSEIDQPALRQVHSILGDVYKNYLGRPSDAAAEFESLLTFPGMPSVERCDTYVAHAESRYLSKEYELALPTLRSCVALCSQADQRAFCERNLKILSGQAGGDAVSLAKNYPMNDDLTLFEWRRDINDEAVKKIRDAAARAEFSRTDETWVASHLAGAVYKVSVLSRKGQEAVTAEVNLWTHTVKVDFHVQ